MAQVRISDDGRIFVDRHPFFPLAARHTPRGATPSRLAEVGFNCIRLTVFGTDTSAIGAMKRDPLELDLGSLLYYPYLYNRADFSADAIGRRADIKKLVEVVSGDPRLLCYEQKNEPSTTYRDPARASADPEGMARGSAYLRSLDSGHPIRVGHMTNSLISTLRRYNEAVDIVGCNPYPISHPDGRSFVGCRSDGRFLDSPNQTLSAVADYTTKMRRVGDGRPVWMQIQAMPNEYWHNEEHTPEQRGQGVYPHHVIWPSFWQMRYMSLAAVIRGAVGLEFALYQVGVDEPGWPDVVRTVSFLSRWKRVLEAPSIPVDVNLVYEELGFSDWSGVEVLGKAGENGTVLITANSQFDPFIVRLSPAPSKPLFEAGEDGSWHPLGPGSTAIRYQPYEAKIILIGEPHGPE